MDADVQRPASNPTAMLAALVSKREKLQEELRKLEDQLYELEGNYLHDSAQCGNVLKGFEGFLSSSKSTTNLKRPRKLQAEDRLFSLSSVTSPVVVDHGTGREDGKSEYGRAKGGGTPANGQGKPKKGGRSALRDGKKIRLSEQDIDDDDDPDLSLR
ncbi:unnamed protein product [Victoria cruziana]